MNPLDHQVMQTQEAQARQSIRMGRPSAYNVVMYGPRIAAMRSLGASYREIGMQLGVSHSTVMLIFREWQK